MTETRPRTNPRLSPKNQGKKDAHALSPASKRARERRMAVARLALEGKTRGEIAVELGITETVVSSDAQWLRGQGLLGEGSLKRAKSGPKPGFHPTRRKDQGSYNATKALLLDRVVNGENYLDVANELGVVRSTAYSWVKAAGVFNGVPHDAQNMNDPEAGERKRRFLTLMTEGYSQKAAALEAGIGETTAGRYAREAGLGREKKAEIKVPAPVGYDSLPWQGKKGVDEFAFYSSYFLGLEWPPWAVIAVNQLLELYESTEDEYAVLNVPPGFGKTTLVTFAFASWVATRERALGGEPRMSLGHSSWGKAQWYVKRLRTLWTFNDKLMRAYGRFKPDSTLAPWSVEELLIEPLKWGLLREKEPTVAAQSYDGAIRSGRFPLVIWDDLIDKRNSATQEAREKLVDWWGDAEERMEPGGLLVLSNARYGPEDLSWHVRQVDADDAEAFADEVIEDRPQVAYHHIAFPAHDEKKCRAPLQEGKHDGPWPDGCLLDPKRGAWPRLYKAMKRNEGRFRVVWQQEDTDPKGFLAERIWFEGGVDRRGEMRKGCFDELRAMGQLPDRPDALQPLISLVSVDPSSSHFWAIEHWLIYPGPATGEYETEQVLLRGARSIHKTHELLYSAQPGSYTGVLEDWWQTSMGQGVPYRYLIYEWNIQKALPEMPYFDDWAVSRSIMHVPHTTTVNKTDPDTGVEMLAPRYFEGSIRLPYLGVDARMFSDQFRKEACAWPEGRTDDLIMAHWFPNHRLGQLIAIARSGMDGDDYDGGDVPAWANRGTPGWAQGRLAMTGGG